MDQSVYAVCTISQSDRKSRTGKRGRYDMMDSYTRDTKVDRWWVEGEGLLYNDSTLGCTYVALRRCIAGVMIGGCGGMSLN